MEQRNEELEDSLDEIRGFDDNFETAYREHKFRDEGEDEQDYGLIGFKKVGENFHAVERRSLNQDKEDSSSDEELPYVTYDYEMFHKFMDKYEQYKEL